MGACCCTSKKDKQTIAELQKQLAFYQAKFRTPEDQMETVGLQLIHHYEKDKSEVVCQGHLADFLEVDPRQHLYKKVYQTLDEALLVNLEIRLYRETFLLVERAILQRKLAKITSTSKLVQICCVECSLDSATLYCPECNDHYCQQCSKYLHSDKATFQNHVVQQLNLNPRNIVYQSVKPIQKNQSPVWRKFEQFNFPLNPESEELFSQIQLHFEYLKRVYVKLNYMNEMTGQIDIASVLIDQNYDSLEREMGRKFKSQHVADFGRRSVLNQKEMLEDASFNDEELYYLNRIAFKLLKKGGTQTKFEKFISALNTLQNDKFEPRLKYWLTLINEHEEDVRADDKVLNLKVDLISKTKFSSVVKASYPQDISGQYEIDPIIDQIFGMDTILQEVQIMKAIIEQQPARNLISCVLQCADN